MTRNTEPDTEVEQLRALLTMSRKLMQTDEPLAALALAGRAMTELAHVDSALLLVRGEVNECIGFDCTGKPHKAPRSHDWYRMASAWLDDGPGDTAMAEPRTMLVGVPTQRAMAVLAAGWTNDAAPAAWDGAATLAWHDS
jgi:hypothetical protein